MEETAASFEARSASPSYSTIYGSGSLLCFFHTSRKNVTCMSAVPAGLRMNFWFRRPHAEARGLQPERTWDMVYKTDRGHGLHHVGERVAFPGLALRR